MNFCQDLIPFLQNSKRLLVITGAGISTESGIPDYRSPGRVQIRTTRHQEFMKSSDLRKRYWARSLFGFEVIQNAKPNSSHLSLAKLEKKQQMLPLIT
jgi:NAD-dependent deacetylase sirtuin 4